MNHCLTVTPQEENNYTYHETSYPKSSVIVFSPRLPTGNKITIQFNVKLNISTVYNPKANNDEEEVNVTLGSLMSEEMCAN